MFQQIIANSIISGAIYGLIASGFSLIYSTNKFIHFAHGATVLVAGYLVYLFFNLLKLNFGFATVLSILLTILLGVTFHLIYQFLRKRKATSTILLIVSVVLLLIFESLVLLCFGADVKTIGFLPVKEGLLVFGARITPLQIFIFFSSLILLISLYFFMKRTKLGKAMRAVASNKEIAETLGISANKIYLITFVLGSALASIAGILIGLEQNLDPSSGTFFSLKGLTASIIGGITSVPGAILGSYLLGFAENIAAWFFPTGDKDAISSILLFLFLLFRPQGILGIKKEGEKC